MEKEKNNKFLLCANEANSCPEENYFWDLRISKRIVILSIVLEPQRDSSKVAS